MIGHPSPLIQARESCCGGGPACQHCAVLYCTKLCNDIFDIWYLALELKQGQNVLNLQTDWLKPING